MLNFTRQERMVIYFLVITLGIGAILKLVRNRRLEENLRPERFYNEEQQFKAISQQINAGDLPLVDSLAGSAAVQTADINRQTESIADSSQPVNINTADLQQLSTLPGIGPAIAGRIKAFRDQHGPFKKKSEIILVKGIGEKLYTRIQGLVTTE